MGRNNFAYNLTRKEFSAGPDNASLDYEGAKADHNKVSVCQSADDENITFGEYCHKDPADYAEVKIEALDISHRSRTRLSNWLHLSTVEKVLSARISAFRNLDGVGQKSVTEVIQAINALKASAFPKSMMYSPAEPSEIVKRYKKQILLGDFSFIEGLTCPKSEIIELESFRTGYQLVGKEMMDYCYRSPAKVKGVILALDAYAQSLSVLMRRKQEVSDLLSNIPRERYRLDATVLIEAYANDPTTKHQLKAIFSFDLASLSSISDALEQCDEQEYLQLTRFLKWCAFSIETEVHELMEKLTQKERRYTIIKMRAERKTLSEVGEHLGLTRERVRQIEAKVIRTFETEQRRAKILLKISALRNGDNVLTEEELVPYLGNHATALIYLFSVAHDYSYTYNKGLGAFIIGEKGVSQKVEDYVDALPNEFKDAELSAIIEKGEIEMDLPRELIKMQIDEEYQQSGTRYHRGRLSLGNMYKIILDQYPNGFRVYDPHELEKFRQAVHREFGNVKLPESNHAITSRIASIGVLCNRGTYRAKRDSYMPSELSQRIIGYIQNHESPIFLTNTLFALFQTELREAGIDNKYYLQGALKEICGDRFIFRRDYISKDATVTSLYSSIIEYIRNFDYPVSKKSIYKAFPGIPDIVLGLAITDTDVISYLGEYIHASKLRITSEDKEYIEMMLSSALIDGKPHHYKEFYDELSTKRNDILMRLCIIYPYPLFGIFEYFFGDRFQFSRPHIASLGVEMYDTADRMLEYIYSKSIVSISEISEMANQEHYVINSILEYIDTLNDDFLYRDKEYIMRIDEMGVSQELCAVLEEKIAEEIDCCVPISYLASITQMPPIQVPWTDWLVYGIIKKWSSKLDVATSSPFYRYAIPLIAPKGKMTDVVKKDFSNNINASSSVQMNNIGNIDDLLSEMYMEEGEWDELP